ncbi:hypothetical protein K440DRAFT_301117 [Wilcoxina mikolae CBS 423.85]|nr:hypothetical protein K440DRAFT_301117 [Wilcoxina mikolae CBS 423.85]
MMVNKLGQMARGLQSYHLAQKKPVEDVKHESPQDMKPTDGWRLCEMGLISKTIDELLQDVKKINQEKPELEEKSQIATKGFIKRKLPMPIYFYITKPLTHQRIVDTKESEIKRLFAVHNDPAAAARARARLLAPEQQLQQRQLRKSFTRIEKALKDTEYKATMFKAKIAARDRHKVQAKFQPPTAEAVRTTVMKLTATAERKSKDVDHLEEKLRRVRLGSRHRRGEQRLVDMGTLLIRLLWWWSKKVM